MNYAQVLTDHDQLYFLPKEDVCGGNSQLAINVPHLTLRVS